MAILSIISLREAIEPLMGQIKEEEQKLCASKNEYERLEVALCAAAQRKAELLADVEGRRKNLGIQIKCK